MLFVMSHLGLHKTARFKKLEINLTFCAILISQNNFIHFVIHIISLFKKTHLLNTQTMYYTSSFFFLLPHFPQKALLEKISSKWK